MSKKPLVVERLYDAPIEKLWQAITDKEQMKNWYFDVPAFEPVVGNLFTFTGENEGRTFLHLCEVKEVTPLKRLSYTWRYEGVEGSSLLTFELFEEGHKTKLRLSHAGLETFPQNKDFQKENFVGGWDYILGTSLPNFLTDQQ